jgi:hypothetical protein
MAEPEWTVLAEAGRVGLLQATGVPGEPPRHRKRQQVSRRRRRAREHRLGASHYRDRAVA